MKALAVFALLALTMAGGVAMVTSVVSSPALAADNGDGGGN